MIVKNITINNKVYFIIALVVILFIQNSSISAQSKNPKIDELIEQGNFDEAILLGTELLVEDPDNAELNFKVGYSYLKTALRKVKAIPFLEKSVDVLNKKKSQISIAVEANFYLGRSYHNNYEFEKAIQQFLRLKETTKNNELLTAIDKEIEQCKVGESLMKDPIKMQINNLSANINSPFSDHSPVISADESVMIFTSRRKRFEGEKLNSDGQYNEDIYISYAEHNSWQAPKGISPNINTESHEASIGLSPDGQQLFIYSGANGGTILTSFLQGDEWSVPEDLGVNINTRFRETHASMSANGRFLYFTSDRPGGSGGLDIYVSEKQEDGSWGIAANLGPSINTTLDEEGPFIHQDGISLYFSSKGHETMGGFDIFTCQKNEFGTWTKPKNLGYPINTIDDDAFYVMTPDGKRAYFSSYREDGEGGNDIYMMALPEAEEKPLTIVKGNVKACDYQMEDILITVFDNENDDIIGLYKPNSKTGKYLFILSRGRNYYAIYEINGEEKHTEEFFISENADFQVIYKPISLIKGSPCDNLTVKTEIKEKIPDEMDLFAALAENEEFTIVENVVFRVNSTQYGNFKSNLSRLAKYLKANPQTKIEIVGYTDTQGPKNYNSRLSENRALVVANYLKKLGVDNSQYTYRGEGTNKQVSINKYKNGSYVWQSLPYNRRVEFNVTNDHSAKLKIVQIHVPVLYNSDNDPEKLKKELLRVDSVYTIQLGAYSQPVQRELFNNVKSVQMYSLSKFFIYTTGEYSSSIIAKNELVKIRKLGYNDAFIRKVSYYFKEMHKNLNSF